MGSKCRIFLTIDKEEKWLNKQLQNGKNLTGPVGDGLYHFIDHPAYSKVIRIDVRKFKTKKEHQEYVQFMADAGWKHISSRDYQGKQYFIGNKSQSDELFSDNQSKYEREVRSRKQLISANALLFVILLPIYLSSKNDTWQYLFNPKSAFFTPNLWQEQGGKFLLKFLFELPLAIGRIGINLLPIILVVYFLYQLVIVQRSIRRYKNEFEI